VVEVEGGRRIGVFAEWGGGVEGEERTYPDEACAITCQPLFKGRRNAEDNCIPWLRSVVLFGDVGGFCTGGR
jgi:hypothetical protein